MTLDDLEWPLRLDCQSFELTAKCVQVIPCKYFQTSK